jgi:pyruvate-ferredoxin/flavodoxin oxidoreductase
MRLALDKQLEYAAELLRSLSGILGETRVEGLLAARQTSGAELEEQRRRVRELKAVLGELGDESARQLSALADVFVKKSVWIVGGDGWAYDIGYGGLDHVLAAGRNVNILVLDSEIYSNTGGQMSKATPRAAVAKLAAAGKATAKKDLAMMAMSYGSVYVARVAMGADDAHTLRAFLEAEAYHGTSLIIAYSHCIGQGFNLAYGMEQQRLAVQSGYWPLMRYDPERRSKQQNPLQLDSRPPSVPLEDYIYNETRYKMLQHVDPNGAKRLLALAKTDVADRWRLYVHLAAMDVGT